MHGDINRKVGNNKKIKIKIINKRMLKIRKGWKRGKNNKGNEKKVSEFKKMDIETNKGKTIEHQEHRIVFFRCQGPSTIED